VWEGEEERGGDVELVLLCVLVTSGSSTGLNAQHNASTAHGNLPSPFLNNLDRPAHATPSVALVQPLELGHIAVSMVFLLHGVHLVWVCILAYRARVVLF
jgi:hypothetical protein